MLGVEPCDLFATVPRDVVLVYHHGRWDFKYLHSYTLPFRQAVLEAYRRHTGIIPDTQRIALYHALSGRDKAGASPWVRQAVAWALA